MLTSLGVGFTRILANKVVEDLRYGIQSDVRAFLCAYFNTPQDVEPNFNLNNSIDYEKVVFSTCFEPVHLHCILRSSDLPCIRDQWRSGDVK